MNVADLWPDAARALGLLSDGPLLRILMAYEGWAYRTADVVCAVTDGVRDSLQAEKGVPPAKLVDLPNGVDTTMFTPRQGDRGVLSRYGLENADLLLYAGTIGYAHGVETAVDAMALLAPTHPCAHLLIVGGGSERDAVARRVAETGTRNVTLADPVPLGEVRDLLAVSRAAVSTLRRSPLMEGVRPSKVFPAMASGVPIIYCGAGEGATIVADAGAGLVVPPEDPVALAVAMRQVLDDPDAATKMGAAGRRLVEERFSWASITASWLDQLDRVGVLSRRDDSANH